jgi:hypothetical protein
MTRVARLGFVLGVAGICVSSPPSRAEEPPPESQRRLTLEGLSERADVTEGLDEAGFEIDGEIVRPSLIRYATDRARNSFAWEMRGGHEIGAELSAGRERVENLTADRVVYDFDVFEGRAGFAHRLARGWRMLWRAGGVRYASNASASIDNESHFLGRLELEREGEASWLMASYHRDTFVRRGFAGDFQFRIFERGVFTLRARRPLGAFRLEARAQETHHDDGNDVFLGLLRLERTGSRVSGWLEAHRDGLPARFLNETTLEFIDYEALALGLSAELPARCGSELELLGRWYEDTPVLVLRDSDGDGTLEQVEGFSDSNFERKARFDLFWRARGALRVGAAYRAEEFDFDTTPYNTNNIHAWSLYTSLERQVVWGLRCSARYDHSLLGDERASDYDADTFALRVARESGRLQGAVAIRLSRNSLDEELRDLRADFTHRL